MNALFFLCLLPDSIECFLVKIYQLHRRHGGFEPFVAKLHPRTIDSLIDCVGSDDAEDDRQAGCQRCMRNSARHFARDVIEMRRLAANDRTETNDCIKLTRLCKTERQQRNLECTGHTIQMNVCVFRSQSLESIERAFHQPRGDQFIPTAGDDCEAKGFSIKTSFMNCRLQAIRLRDLNSYYVWQYRRCFETHQVDEFCR